MASDKETDTAAREANYTSSNDGDASKLHVIQRTEGGFSRGTTRTLPNDETHTRSVDEACEKDVGKCVKQVEVDPQP